MGGRCEGVGFGDVVLITRFDGLSRVTFLLLSRLALTLVGDLAAGLVLLLLLVLAELIAVGVHMADEGEIVLLTPCAFVAGWWASRFAATSGSGGGLACCVRRG